MGAGRQTGEETWRQAGGRKVRRQADRQTGRKKGSGGRGKGGEEMGRTTGDGKLKRLRDEKSLG